MSTRKSIFIPSNPNKRKKTVSLSTANKSMKLETRENLPVDEKPNIPDDAVNVLVEEVNEMDLGEPPKSPESNAPESEALKPEVLEPEVLEPEVLKPEVLEPEVLEPKYSEFYLGSNYCSIRDNEEEYYAKDSDNNEIFLTTEDGKTCYAVKKIKINDEDQFIEFPPTLNDGKKQYIYEENGIPKYPVNRSTIGIVFPRDPNTNEEMYIPNLNGTINYATNFFGEVYRKDAEGNDVVLNNEYAKEITGKQIYPKLKNGDEFCLNNEYVKDEKGTQFYPKLKNGDQFYLKTEDGKSEVGAIAVINGFSYLYYARKKNGDEFYPRKWEID